MILCDISLKRPVLASVINILLVILGLVAFDKLPLREYPNIDSPIISIDTRYRGANAQVVETRITQLIEDSISGIQGIRNITSASKNGRSSVVIEFNSNRNIDIATNDVRDSISSIVKKLPAEATPPQIKKANSNAEVIMWLNLSSDKMNIVELTDYAQRYLLDKFSVIDGVATVKIGGGKLYAMRIWLDRQALAAHQLSPLDIEASLKAQNVELPAGSIESQDMVFTLGLERNYLNAEDFKQLVVAQGASGYPVKLEDVARIELGSEEERITFRGDGAPMIGIGIIKQSNANTLEVAKQVTQLAPRIALPKGMKLQKSYDSSVFIQASIDEVYQTLFIAIILVILVIFLFLGDIKATLIPAVTVPISLIATFMALYILGYTINLLTLLALILAIGMVVDDAIVMLENIHRRITLGEHPISAAFLGAKEVAFAIIATTLVLVAVFAPISFIEGSLGRLFKEFAVTISIAVIFSSLVALLLSPLMCSRLLSEKPNKTKHKFDAWLITLTGYYRQYLSYIMRRPLALILTLIASVIGALSLFSQLPQEYAPAEDRGAFFLQIKGPQGASYSYMSPYIDEIETRLLPMLDSGEVMRLQIRAPRNTGPGADFSDGMAVIVLNDWAERRDAFSIMKQVRSKLADLAGVKVSPVMRQGFGLGVSKPVSFVIGGSQYKDLVQWRDIMLAKAADNPNLLGLDHDYDETKPQLKILIDKDRATALGITMAQIGRTLESMLGSRLVTNFMRDGRQYNVIVEGQRDQQRSIADLKQIYVKSEQTGKQIPLANLVSVKDYADVKQLNRYNKTRSITLEANLAQGYSLGEALDYLNSLAEQHLPEEASISYKGQSLNYIEANSSAIMTLVLALAMVFLVLAAQFESYIHPLIIMFTVPLAVVGAFIGLWLTGQSINIYSQIGLLILIGLATKNGILIVEFINQLRSQGIDYQEAILTGASQRLRPILMTGITTAAGAIPLVLATGAGAETRFVIGVVILCGIVIATLFTLFIVPSSYYFLAKNTQAVDAAEKELTERLARTTQK